MDIMKVHIARNNMQVQFIRFRQKISPLFRFSFSYRGIQSNIAHRTQFQTRQGLFYCHSIGPGPPTGYNWYSHHCQVRVSPFHSFVVVGHPIMLSMRIKALSITIWYSKCCLTVSYSRLPLRNLQRVTILQLWLNIGMSVVVRGQHSPAAKYAFLLNLAKIPPNQVIADFGRGSSLESECEWCPAGIIGRFELFKMASKMATPH